MEETEWVPSEIGQEFHYKHRANPNSWAKATLYGFYNDMLWIQAEGNTSPHTIRKNSVFVFAQEEDMFIQHWLEHAEEAIKHDMFLYGGVQSLETMARLFHAHHLLKLPEE